jgi:transposase
MEKDIKVFVGLDTHKSSIAIGVAEAGRQAGRAVGTVAHDVPKLVKVLAKLGPAQALQVVYEAGPTGYGLQRELAKRGYRCEVIAPSLTPQRVGDRIKTDRRDCVRLAELSRSGELRAVWVPDTADEAVRDLSRAREDAVNGRTQARHQLSGFLLRYGLFYPGKTRWTKTYYAWLGTLKFADANSQLAFTEYCLQVQGADQRVGRLTQALEPAIRGWRFESVVQALRAMRGLDLVSAVGIVAEVGDIGRFDHPRKLMGYLGLVPAQHSSGERVRRGSITKTGNAHARRLLIQAAWNYRFGPRIARQALQRQRDLPEPIRAIAWKAQVRLTGRFQRLQGRGVQINKVCVAVARELSGFIWAIAMHVQARQQQAS